MLEDDRLRDLLSVILEVDPVSIGMDSNMDNIESWNSLRHMDIILGIEEEFGVSIPDDEAASLTSYGLLLLTLKELLEVQKCSG